MKDLAARHTLDLGTIHILSTEPVTWSDLALGCPKTGREYPQQTVPGYMIHLEANGQEFVYHTDKELTVILCMDEMLPSYPVTPGEIDDWEPWMPVN